jgi:stage II sporulation protein D
MFAADVFYDKDFVKGLLIYGGGWGHGVGLCQSGAAGRAEAGLTYEQILPAYYPGAALSDLRYLK